MTFLKAIRRVSEGRNPAQTEDAGPSLTRRVTCFQETLALKTSRSFVAGVRKPMTSTSSGGMGIRRLNGLSYDSRNNAQQLEVVPLNQGFRRT